VRKILVFPSERKKKKREKKREEGEVLSLFDSTSWKKDERK